MSAWVLPDHIADVLPAEARLIEDLRRELLDCARRYGYELVIPPLVEHIESLLSGSGEDLDMRTFKLVDLLSGRTLGVRADTTQQTARLDAHLLNRPGTTRLCYCGPVLHTRPQQPNASREPLQFGAELYGCDDIFADLEVLLLALDVLQTAQANHSKHKNGIVLDLADARIVPALLAQAPQVKVDLHRLQQALITKNADALQQEATDLPAPIQQALLDLLQLYGTADVLEQARQRLPALPAITQALDELAQLAAQISKVHPDLRVQLDLADSQGYSYYSGMRFAIFLPGGSDAIVRGGRYDEVGAAYGRTRPAVGFSLDIKSLAQYAVPRTQPAAICAVWENSTDWLEAVQALRRQGEIVVVTLPCQAPQTPEPIWCDRILTRQNGVWRTQPMQSA